MTFSRKIVSAAICATAAISSAANAGLSFFNRDDLMIIHGKAESADVAKLKEKLTPAIKTIVLRSPTGMDWATARELGDVIAAASVTTVVHGACEQLACPAMFLSGKNRMFSGASRPETHYVSLAIGEPDFVFAGTQDKLRETMSWWKARTKLKGADLEVRHASFFSVTHFSETLDKVVFFPLQAKLPNGNAMHCSGSAKSRALIDCAPIQDSDALVVGIVTTAESFTNPRLTEAADTVSPPPSGFARIDDREALPAGHSCKQFYAEYLRQPSPKAFVVNAQQGCSAANQQAFRPLQTAIARCQNSKGSECRAYAVDDQVVFVPFDQALPNSPTAKPVAQSAQAPQSLTP